MFLLDNPVLQRELLVNLRMARAFALLFVYILLLGVVVFIAWPNERQLDLTNSFASRRLVDLFFAGQYLLASLMAPSFAAGAITGEKERKSYEMLLASPLRPGAIVLGKLLAALCHLAILILASLPIVMLCLPLGGVSFYEVLTAYLALVLSVVSYGMISLACSAYFKRTSSSLVVAYLIVLPLALTAVLIWQTLAEQGEARIGLILVLLPPGAAVLCVTLFTMISRRLLYPPDVGSEGKEVVDIDQEARQAVGLVIQRDQFPDRLFAPAKRTDLLKDGANPVLDKELRSEIFAQGTLMLRVVIQVSIILAVPLMAVCLYLWPENAPWYISYVVLFNLLVGPVFSAASVTSERERETLDLLLTTILSPWQILWAKLISGLRVSSVLTTFLLWPLLLAWLMVPQLRGNLPITLAYLVIIAVTCLTTAVVALFASVMFRKSSTALMAAYLGISLLFAGPLAVEFFAKTFFPVESPLSTTGQGGAEQQQAGPPPPRAGSGIAPQPRAARVYVKHPVDNWTFTSPVATAFALPIAPPATTDLAAPARQADWYHLVRFLMWYLLLDGGLLATMVWLFNQRWRVTE